jgi:hypothetical protein
MIEESVKLSCKDSVIVNYKSKSYNIVNVTGTIIHDMVPGEFPFKVKLEDEFGKSYLLGHDDDGGGPGSGSTIYCKEGNLKLVKKYVPKKLEGITKKSWKVGDKFTPKKGFDISLLDSAENNETGGAICGILPDMVLCHDKELRVATIINKLGFDLIMDDYINYFWLPEWITPIE